MDIVRGDILAVLAPMRRLLAGGDHSLDSSLSKAKDIDSFEDTIRQSLECRNMKLARSVEDPSLQTERTTNDVPAGARLFPGALSADQKEAGGRSSNRIFP